MDLRDQPEEGWLGLGEQNSDLGQWVWLSMGQPYYCSPPPVPFEESYFVYTEAIPSLGPAPVGILSPANSRAARPPEGP